MDLSNMNILLNIIEKLKTFFVWIFKNKSKFNKAPFYFKTFHKHVTVYENGNGILINSFDIVFNDISTKKLVRGINIEDGKKNAKFESLENMMKIDISDRFDKCGFWVYSDNDIVENVIESYWEDEDYEQEDNNKELKWRFKFNKSKIEFHKPYRIVYIISIPGMFPIKNGKLDFSEIVEEKFDGYSHSSIATRTPTERLTYTMSFYNSILLKSEPEAIVKPIESTKRNVYVPIRKEYNIIYNKYICYIKSPQLGSKLRIKWKFED